MAKKIPMLVAAVLILGVGACATTATTSLTRYKSDKAPNKIYTNVMIAVDGTDLDSQAKAEDYGVKTLRNNFNAEALAWHDLFPPIEKYSPKTLWRKIREKGVDGILLVTYESGSSSLQSVLIPTTHASTSRTSATVSKVGSADTYKGQATTHTTWTEFMPVVYSVYSMRTSIQFIDTATRRAVWVGVANTAGDAVALMPSLASKIVGVFKTDGLMEPRASRKIRP